jgi:hypothetical protein
MTSIAQMRDSVPGLAPRRALTSWSPAWDDSARDHVEDKSVQSPQPPRFVKFNTLSEGQEPPPTTPSGKGISVPLHAPCQLPLFPFLDLDIVPLEAVQNGLLPQPSGDDWTWDLRTCAWHRAEPDHWA